MVIKEVIIMYAGGMIFPLLRNVSSVNTIKIDFNLHRKYKQTATYKFTIQFVFAIK
jgi:glutaredoxin 2